MASYPANVSATASTISTVASIPILMAAIGFASNAARIWAATRAAGMVSTATTALCVCAVTAVIASDARTPNSDSVAMSGAMPAPPEESEPATTSTCGGLLIAAAP